MDYIPNSNPIKITYAKNKEGSYLIEAWFEEDTGEQWCLQYPRVEVSWFMPARANYFALPIPTPEGFKVLPDINETFYNLIIPNNENKIQRFLKRFRKKKIIK